MPTLFENLFGCKNPVEDYSIGQNLLKPNGRLSFELAVGVFNLGIVEKDKITSLIYSGQDVTAKVTDKEGRPLPDAKPDVENDPKSYDIIFKKIF